MKVLVFVLARERDVRIHIIDHRRTLNVRPINTLKLKAKRPPRQCSKPVAEECINRSRIVEMAV